MTALCALGAHMCRKNETSGSRRDLDFWETAGQRAEDEGFEPSMVLPPNRISSVIAVVLNGLELYATVLKARSEEWSRY